MLKLDKNTYIISDLHLLHNNIIKYCNRPFKDCVEMYDSILSQFDKLPEECTIWNLGDLINLSSKLRLEDVSYVVDRMRGKAGKRKLYLVLGNHDNCTLNGSRVAFYKTAGFDEVYDTPIIIDDNKIFSHEPVYMKGDDFINYYGHTHIFNVDKDYFTYDYDNYNMKKRAAEKEGIEIGPIEKAFPEKTVNEENYINVCWDVAHGFLKIS